MNLLLDEGTLHAKIYLCTFSHCNFFVYGFLYIFILCDRRIRWNGCNIYRYPISFLSKKRKPSLISLSSVYLLVSFFVGKSIYLKNRRYKFHIAFSGLAISLNLCNCITNPPNLITIL